MKYVNPVIDPAAPPLRRLPPGCPRRRRPCRPPTVVARNATETWLIRNYHTSMPHAMHLHGVQFRVLERETSPDVIASLVVDKRGRIATDMAGRTPCWFGPVNR